MAGTRIKGGRPSPEGIYGVLELRRKAYDRLKRKDGTKRPGSLSGRKQA